MTDWKEGDRVLVAMEVTRVLASGDIHAKYLEIAEHYVYHHHIHGLAPKPPVDWSAVPWGTRVRYKEEEALFLHLIGDELGVVRQDEDCVRWVKATDCELIEGGNHE